MSTGTFTITSPTITTGNANDTSFTTTANQSITITSPTITITSAMYTLPSPIFIGTDTTIIEFIDWELVKFMDLFRSLPDMRK